MSQEQDEQNNQQQKPSLHMQSKVLEELFSKQQCLEGQGDEEEELVPQTQCRNIQGISIFCSICKDFIVHSVTTNCQHTFCELCLTEYMLFIDQCPECFLRIRNQKISNNILLDNLVADYVRKYEPNDYKDYESRLEDYKNFKKNKTVTDLQTGTLVDIRDQDFIWCTGKVHRIVNKVQDKKNKFIIIKYDKSTKKQEIAQNSPRLAPFGFYTGREDLPRYERGKLILKNTQENITYLIPKYEKEDEEQPQNIEQKQ